MESKLHIPCQNFDNCPLAPECYEDDHHIFPRRLGKTASVNALPEEDQKLIRKFIEDPRHKIRSCRDIHRRVLDSMPVVLPPLDYIREYGS